MRYFLVALFGLIVFFSPAQNVVIPAEVARHFLEQDDRAKLLKKKDSVNQKIILTLNEELSVKRATISSYKTDSIKFISLLSNKDKEVALINQELKVVKKDATIKSLEVSLLTGTSAGAIIGSGVPGIGTVTGAVVGTVAGGVVYGVRGIKKLFIR